MPKRDRQQKARSARSSDEGKVPTILLWIPIFPVWLIGLIWILATGMQRKSKLASFWFSQWLALLVFSLIGIAVSALLMIILIGFALMAIVFIFAIVSTVIALIRIANDETTPLPIIGKYGVKWFNFR